MIDFNQEAALTRARESRTAIEVLYIEMRHLMNRGAYRPRGMTGRVILDALNSLNPEIYGSMNDPNKVELNGLVYVIDRLPRGIEACRFVRLISEEGYGESDFEVIVPTARRRNCYRVDKERMLIEVTRGRSEIYDILTHLTFLYAEAEKIKRAVSEEDGGITSVWKKLEEIALGQVELTPENQDKAFSYLSAVLGRTYGEVRAACRRLEANPKRNNGIFQVVYYLGKLALEDEREGKYRQITFSPTLRARIGHHLYGERWANNIKAFLLQEGLAERPIHVISANMHSVLNTLFGYAALRDHFGEKAEVAQIASALSKPDNYNLQREVEELAEAHGMTRLSQHAGTHIHVQLFDCAKMREIPFAPGLDFPPMNDPDNAPVLLVMDYAFGEQAYEMLDELLKPYTVPGKEEVHFYVDSISVMGKAGILEGKKGDIMVPNAFVFEGTADNYPLENDFSTEAFTGNGLSVFEGPMITVLGTSLQNRDILAYFKNSSWRAIGLEMEGAHYQKAIQSQVHIRKNVRNPVKLRYAYYASDNPLVTGHTLASGSLGSVGVRPTYLITQRVLEHIFAQAAHAPKAVQANGTAKPE